MRLSKIAVAALMVVGLSAWKCSGDKDQEQAATTDALPTATETPATEATPAATETSAAQPTATEGAAPSEGYTGETTPAPEAGEATPAQ
jgi:hypothetical protein